MSSPDFAEYCIPAPTYDDVAAGYAEINAVLDEAGDKAAGDAQAIEAVRRWDDLRRRIEGYSELVYIRFYQDTQYADYKAAREKLDALKPKLTDLEVAMKRRLMDSPHRDALAAHFGAHVFDLWRADVAAFDPAIQDDLVEQARLDAQYTELRASAEFEFQGETLTLAELAKFDEHPQRDVRHDAARLRWDWFADNRDELDAIFDQLVRLRAGMAEKLGLADFIELGYLQMQRVDYGRDEVERFRAQVREHVVPLATDIRRRQTQRLGVERLMAWDEGIHNPDGNPRPAGDHDWMIERATEMFAGLGHGLDAFFREMNARNLMDLKSREGKAGGGFCASVPSFGMPFIFANFNGTKGDVEVFTHEMGHAFQNYQSRNLPLSDYFWPTSESCEIHSMGLEFLTWPQMERFFGDDAEQFRRLHLIESLLIIPYITAVDHFQHLVYAEPDATADRRAQMWQEMEQIYLPTLNWGDLAHPASGRRWQLQLHIYGAPFYYIDYALALTCALQFWLQAEQDRDDAMTRYVALCRRGGEAPFGELVRSAGLTSPLVDGCLAEVVQHARRHIDESNP